MIRYRILFHLLIGTIAASLGLVVVGGYVALFQHDRYWNGTVSRVVDTEIALLESFLATPGMGNLLLRELDAIPMIFEPLTRKVAISVAVDGKAFYSNHVTGWERKPDAKILATDQPRLEITVQRYIPPSWHLIFKKWLSSPSQWLTYKYDFITVPFLMFSLLLYFIFLALAWRYRASHLSNDVIALLENFGRDHESPG